MSVSAQKVTEKFLVRKIYQSSRFNNKNSFSENSFFSYLYVYARAHVRMWTHARPMRTTTMHQYNRTFKNNSYRSFTHFQRFMAVSNFPISFRLFCRHQKFIFRKLCLVQLTYSQSVPALLLKLISLFFQQTLGKTLWVGHLNEEKI